MKEEEKKQEKKKLEPKGKSSQSWGLLACFLISAFFWLTLKLSQDKIHSMQIPVDFIMPENYTSTQDLPKSIPFNIKARTGNLMTLNYRMQRSPLKIPLNESNQSYSSEQLSEMLNKRIYAKVENIYTLYEMPKINLDTIIEKSVTLISNNEIEAKEGYSILREKITPSTIKIKGASKLLDEINSLYLSKIVLKNLDTNFSDSVHILKNYSELIELSQEKAKLEITLDQLVQKQIEFYNFILNDTVRLKLSTPASLYDRIDSSYFKILVSDNKVEIVSKNAELKILEFSPVRY